jgi:DNA repair exonuclease SbcCD nuclease subunit
MKIAIITDTHYGARRGSKLFHDYFEQFYKNIFFPTLEQEGIDTVVHMGDAFDSRKSIDYQSLEWAKKVVFDPLKKYNVHMIIGNHDVYYKNTNEINSPGLLLQSYLNIKTYSKISEVKIGNLDVLFIPWINTENYEDSIKLIQNTSCKCAMGHLELNGFQAHRGHTMEDGMESELFEKFGKVYSGHYHTRSDNGKIFYLGNPYEIYWNDLNDPRGFTIFDTETLEHKSINNPYRMFYSVVYEDTPHQTLNTSEFKDKIVKVIVRKKSNQNKFDKFIDKIYSANVAELKIVENYQIQQLEEFEDLESEDTLSILNRYIQESEIDMNKSVIQNLIKEIYQEACEIV